MALAVVVTLYIAADARAPRGASLKSQFLRPTTKIRWACSATLFESSRCPSSSTFLPWSDRVPESCKLDPAAAEKAKEMPDDFIINIDPDAFDDEMANNAEEGL